MSASLSRHFSQERAIYAFHGFMSVCQQRVISSLFCGVAQFICFLFSFSFFQIFLLRLLKQIICLNFTHFLAFSLLGSDLDRPNRNEQNTFLFTLSVEKKGHSCAANCHNDWAMHRKKVKGETKIDKDLNINDQLIIHEDTIETGCDGETQFSFMWNSRSRYPCSISRTLFIALLFSPWQIKMKLIFVYIKQHKQTIKKTIITDCNVNCLLSEMPAHIA